MGVPQARGMISVMENPTKKIKDDWRAPILGKPPCDGNLDMAVSKNVGTNPRMVHQ